MKVPTEFQDSKIEFIRNAEGGLKVVATNPLVGSLTFEINKAFTDGLIEYLTKEETVKLEKGVRVQITAHAYLGLNGTIIAVDEPYFEVKIDNMEDPLHFKANQLRPFPKSAQPANEPQPEPPAPPAFAVGTRNDAPFSIGKRVKTRHGLAGEIIEVSHWGLGQGRIRIKADRTGDLQWHDVRNLEPLPSDPGAPAGALPAGVTPEGVKLVTHIQTVEKLMDLAFLFGVTWAGPEATFKKILEQFAALMFTIEANALAMNDGNIKSDLLKTTAKYAERMEHVKAIQENQDGNV